MSMTRAFVALALAVTTPTAFAQGYIGGAFGVGGADVDIGSFASGFRGGARLFGGYAFDPHFALEAIVLSLGAAATDHPLRVPPH
jgi:hypothetical protein